MPPLATTNKSSADSMKRAYREADLRSCCAGVAGDLALLAGRDSPGRSARSAARAGEAGELDARSERRTSGAWTILFSTSGESPRFFRREDRIDHCPVGQCLAEIFRALVARRLSKRER